MIPFWTPKWLQLSEAENKNVFEPQVVTKSELDTGASVDEEKQTAYQQQFHAIASSDVDTSNIENFMPNRETDAVMDQITGDVSNYFGTMKDKLGEKVHKLFNPSDKEEHKEE